MEGTVLFRDFEERDIDFVYQCKNDEKLNSLTTGQWHPFTYEEAKNGFTVVWVTTIHTSFGLSVPTMTKNES